MTLADLTQSLARLLKAAGDCRIAQKDWWQRPGNDTRRCCLDAERRLDRMLAELRDVKGPGLFADQEGA